MPPESRHESPLLPGVAVGPMTELEAPPASCAYWNRRMDEIQADDDRQEILGMLARSCMQISPDSADRECGDLVPIHPDMRANLEILVSAGLVRLVETPWVGDKTALKYIATPLGRRRMREAYALLGIPTSAGVR